MIKKEKKGQSLKDKDKKLVERSLKILKVLYYIWTNVNLFTNEGITFLLLKSNSENEL